MDDRRELLKLRQGLVNVGDSNLEIDEKPKYGKPVGFKAKADNFFYHYKPHLVIGGFLVCVITGILFMSLGNPTPDVTVLLVSDNNEISSWFFFNDSLTEDAFRVFTPDFTGKGNHLARCWFIDLVTEGRNPQAAQGNMIKLYGEMQSAGALIFIGNRQVLENIPDGNIEIEDFYLNMSERYHDNPLIIDDFFLSFAGSHLAEHLDSEPPEDLFIVVRVNLDTARFSTGKAAQTLEQALTVLDNIVLNQPV